MVEIKTDSIEVVEIRMDEGLELRGQPFKYM